MISTGVEVRVKPVRQTQGRQLITQPIQVSTNQFTLIALKEGN